MFGHRLQLQEQHFTIGQLDMRGKMNKSGDSHALPPQARSGKRFRRRPDLSNWFDRSPSSSTEITSTGSQTYTVPRRVDRISIEMIGGGGGGGKKGKSSAASGGGGGSSSSGSNTIRATSHMCAS